MAKPKSFKAELNPALQFISMNQEIPEISENSESINEQNTQEMKTDIKDNKKSKTQNLNQNPLKNQTNKIEHVPAGYKLNPQYIETKSKRLQLLMQPSLYEKIKEHAINKELSVNELIHSILDEYIDKI